MDKKLAFVSLKDINKIYPNGVQAVYDFNIDIDKNDFIVLVGPSGCGKSTTLRMIAGLEEITSGYLYIDNVLTNFVNSKDRDISMVFQNYALYPQMTVFDNIAFPLKARKHRQVVTAKVNIAWNEVLKQLREPNKVIETLKKASFNRYGSASEYLVVKYKISDIAAQILVNLNLTDVNQLAMIMPSGKTLWEEIIERAKKEKEVECNELVSKGFTINENYEVLKDGVVLYEEVKLSKAEIKRRVFEAAKILDLGPYLDRRPKELSGGQMQRVALGRAIVRNSKLFLMDEPLSNLDAKLRVQMRSEIVRIHEQIGATTIYVTHDQTEAMTMATKIVVMSKGWVQQIGTPQEIYNNPNNIFVATFIGSPAMNIFNGIYDNGKVILDNGYCLTLSKDFILRHDKYYQDKINDLKRMLDTSDFKKLHALKVIDDVLFKLDEQIDVNNLDKKISEIINLANDLGCNEVADLLTVSDYSKLLEEIGVVLNNNAKDKLLEIKSIIGDVLDEFGLTALACVDKKLETLDSKKISLDNYNKFIANVNKCLDIVSDLDNSTIKKLLLSINFDNNLSINDKNWLLEIRNPLLSFNNISSKDIAKLHNAQVFSKEEVVKEEVLYYQKPKKKKKVVNTNINFAASDIEFENSLYEVAVNLLKKCEDALVSNHPIRIGIRPENIHLDSEFTGNKSDSFVVNSDIVELLGSELLIYAKWAGSNLISKVSTNVFIKPHTDVNLTFDNDKILVFDDYSGDTI